MTPGEGVACPVGDQEARCFHSRKIFPQKAMKPSYERGCKGKAKLGRNKQAAIKSAEKLALKYGKRYGLYVCPWCLNHHLTTKPVTVGEYELELVYVTR